MSELLPEGGVVKPTIDNKSGLIGLINETVLFIEQILQPGNRVILNTSPSGYLHHHLVNKAISMLDIRRFINLGITGESKLTQKAINEIEEFEKEYNSRMDKIFQDLILKVQGEVNKGNELYKEDEDAIKGLFFVRGAGITIDDIKREVFHLDGFQK